MLPRIFAVTRVKQKTTRSSAWQRRAVLAQDAFVITRATALIAVLNLGRQYMVRNLTVLQTGNLLVFEPT